MKPNYPALTNHQKQVLCIVFLGPTNGTPYDQFAGSQQTEEAKRLLVQDGWLDNTRSGTIRMNQKGIELMKAESLLDQNGNITDNGKQVVGTIAENTKYQFLRSLLG